MYTELIIVATWEGEGEPGQMKDTSKKTFH